MKVKDLIAELKSYNPQARVIVPNEDDDWSYLYRVGWSYDDDDGETNKNLVKLN